MNPIPYYFLWSQDYVFFAKALKYGLSLHKDLFEDRSLFIEQEIFNKHMNKGEGHHFSGCFFKLQKIYDLLTKLPENSYFIMSDADIILFPAKKMQDLFAFYMGLDADMVCMRDAPRLNVSNVGFMLIKVSQVNRDFYRKVLEQCEKEPTGLDQSIVNGLLKTYKGTHFYFPHELVATTCSLKEVEIETPSRVSIMRSKLMVFQALCDVGLPKNQILEQKFLQYKALGIPITQIASQV